MPVRHTHDQNPNSIYFVTFTCFQWRNLFDIANAYDSVYKWFDYLYEKEIRINGYVIMPNHVHSLLYFPKMIKSLNIVIGNAKRFMAYNIIENLEHKKEIKLLEDLYGFVKPNERKKGQRHKVFEDSFDAKECYNRDFILQKLDYMHKNPVSKKWNLVNDFTEYKHSSAGFYERGIVGYDKLLHIGEVW